MSREREVRGEGAQEAEMSALTAGKRSLVASRYPALAQALGDHGGGAAGEPTIHDAATAAVEHKGGGAAVDPGVAARVGAHLGADFSGVRVHSDPLAQQATAAMGARAFAYGGDVFLGAGESGGDVGLMAHELTHVAQQGAAGQRAVQRRVQVGDADSPAEREADQVAAAVTGGQGRPATLLVDDGPVQPGQMLKSQFLEQLRAEVTAAADAELGPIYSAIGCPYIEQYFGRYGGQPAGASEALLRRYAPAVRTARAAADMIPAVVARVREGVRAWRDTGQAPPDLAAMAPSGAAAAGGGAAAAPEQAQAQALRAPDGGETLASLEAELGPGAPLNSATASRMSDALGVDVSSARIHTGPVAARKAADAGALAFAVGSNVVMGAGAPSAGTLEGDALLAHELAHTAQQASAAADPLARRSSIQTEDAAAEDAADRATAGAVARLAGLRDRGAEGRSSIASRFRGSLSLQRCSKTDEKAEKIKALQKEKAQLEAITAQGSGKSFGEVAAAHTKLIDVKHDLAVLETGTGIYEGTKTEHPTAGAQKADCTTFVLDVLKATFTQQGKGADWAKVEKKYKANEATREKNPKVKKGLSGLDIQAALQSEAGWKGIYWAPDPAYQIPKEQLSKANSDEASYTNTIAQDKGTYYKDYGTKGYPGVSIDQRVTNYAPEAPKAGYGDASKTKKDTTQLDKLKKLPFGVLSAHAGQHMTLITSGKVIEVHWKEDATSVNVVAQSDMESWAVGSESGFHFFASGVIVAPPGDVDAAFK